MSELATITASIATLVAGIAFILQMRTHELDHRRELTLEFYRSINRLLNTHNSKLRPGIVGFLMFLVENIDNSNLFNKIIKEMINKRKMHPYINNIHSIYYEIKTHDDTTIMEIDKTIALFILTSSFYNYWLGSFFRCICNLMSSDDPAKTPPKRLKILLTKEYGFSPFREGSKYRNIPDHKAA